MFRVAQPYLNLLVKPRFFFQVFKIIILCILKGDVPFKMHKIMLFSRKKSVCVPTLTKIFRPVIRNTLIFFIWPKLGSQDLINDIWIDGHIEAFYFL